MKKASILLVDDDRDILESYRFLLSDDYQILVASSVTQAKKELNNSEIEVAVVDLNFEGHEQDGLTLIDYILEYRPDVAITVLSSDSNTKRVIEANNRPNTQFVTKDEDSEGFLRQAIEMALAKRQNQNKEIEFKTQSPLVKRLLLKIDRVLESNSSAPILILGESGTGKEFLAKYIAKKLNKKVVAANMASIPKDTAESELFGHKRGAFTGALNDKPGLMEVANDGVFFLDEIGDCSLSIQAKLLRVLQEKEIQPMGALAPKKINLRFIAATHRNLEEMIKEDEFRLDLHQRLNTFTFTIPSLKDRPEDIEYFTRIFIDELTDGENFMIDPKALDVFKCHSWPGNVRELRNVIERAVVYSNRRCLDLDTAISALGAGKNQSEAVTTGRVLTKMEIINAINTTLGNKTKAAKILEVDPSTLHRWIKKFEITDIPKAQIGRPNLRLN